MPVFKDFKVSVGLVKMLQAYAESRGVVFDKVAQKHGFDSKALNNGAASILASKFANVWFKIAETSKDSCPGLNLGKQSVHYFPSNSILFSLMQNSPNIGIALDLLVRHHRIMAEKIQPVFLNKEDFLLLSWDFSVLGSHHLPYLSEAFLCTCYSVLTRLSQGRIRPVSVNFIHQGPKRVNDKAGYESYFNAPIHFLADRDELVIESRDLDIVIELADPALLNLMERYAVQMGQAVSQGNKWSGRVAGLISEAVFKGCAPLIDTIARELALSKRSLQEKLKNENTNFRGLVQTVRKKIAIDQLADPDVSVCEVAFMLGYSDQSAFNHAFKKWTGKSPKAFTMTGR
ncbi:helix-turn-helix domain-containing protein [Desulfospira joergensenii]|uniref:helix-turn-helix domain-containing protein n=1 Tax=Desulfospira joergensenii TaxID=53329 RepID=UPI0003F75BC8|nr:AraC family transcriptional regulator [Desulfospira joergensenii]